MIRSGVMWGGLVFFVAVGCSSSIDEDNADGVTYVEFCDRYAERICPIYWECGCWYSQDACVQKLRRDCGAYGEGVGRSGRAFEPDAAEACLAQVEAGIVDCNVVDATHILEYRYCFEWRGTTEEGESCARATDCVEPEGTFAMCGLPTARGPVTCLRIPRAQLDAECDPRFEPCLEHLWCTPEARCAEKGDVGAPCVLLELGGVSSCVDGLYCSPATATCAEPAGAGEPCEKTFERSSCVPGYDCYRDDEATCQPSSVTVFGVCE
jgi:hypothetical protein